MKDSFGSPDYRFCGDCKHYDPAWTRGWAAHGKIYKGKLREGECRRFGLVVRERTVDEDGCWEEA